MRLLRNTIIDAADRHVDQFTRCLGAFEERGILNSEMLAVCAVCGELGVDIVIESGRARGQSTIMLARYFQSKDVHIYSIEFHKDEDALFAEQRLRPYHNVTLMYGDSCVLIPELLNKLTENRIAVLIDGPKGALAVQLLQVAFAIGGEIVVGFVHDTAKGFPARQIVLSIDEHAFFTDDDDFVKRFSYLDRPIVDGEHTWRPYHKGNNRTLSYGPTLAIVDPHRAKKLNALETFLRVNKWRVRSALRPLKPLKNRLFL